MLWILPDIKHWCLSLSTTTEENIGIASLYMESEAMSIEHNGHVDKMSASGYSDQQFKHWQHQYVVLEQGT